MMLSLYAVVLCVAVGHVAAAVYGEHEVKDEMKNYLLYDVSMKHGKGNIHQAYDVLSDLHLDNAYKIVGEPRALFEVADKHACQDHVVDIPGTHVDVRIARPLTSLAGDFNVTLNNTNEIKYPDNKYLTLIEATYQDQDVTGGTEDVLKKVVDGFVAVHDSADCDNCIRGHVIVGSRPHMVIYLANVKPADMLELYETLGLNAGSATAQARRLINFHSYMEGKSSNCFNKGDKSLHGSANSGIVYDIKPIQGYGNAVSDISIHGGKQGSGYEAKKSIPSYENNRQNDVTLPNYDVNLGAGYGGKPGTGYEAKKSIPSYQNNRRNDITLPNYNANLGAGYGGKSADLGGKSAGFGGNSGGFGGKSAGYGGKSGSLGGKTTPYGADKSNGYDDIKIHPTDDTHVKTGGAYRSNRQGQNPHAGYENGQNAFYTGYNPPKQGSFNFNLGSKDATQHLFVFKK